MTDAHDFQERFNYAEGIDPDGLIEEYLLGTIPGARFASRSTEAEDKRGTDLWIRRDHGLPALSFDFKHRDFDPMDRFGSDDVCVETTSIYDGPGPPWLDEHRKAPGWTVDWRKRTDFVVYTWPNEEGRRFWIVSFPILCWAATVNRRRWADEFGERAAANNGYRTLSIYPTRAAVAAAMRSFHVGVLK